MKMNFEYFQMGVCVPRPSDLSPHPMRPQPQSIASLNTILVFDFDVLITLKV